MHHTDNIKHLRKLLSRYQSQFTEQANELLATLAGEDASSKRNAASKTAGIIQSLRELVPDDQVPECLTQLESILNQLSGASLKAPGAIGTIVKLLPEISNHKWLEQTQEEYGFDFESIFRDCRDRSKIPQLFDSIIELLEKIRDSDEIDSRSMIDALTDLIATLQIGKKSTCFSLDGAWDFLIGFIQNYFWAEAKKIPGIGSLVEALEKTITEAGEEMKRLQDEVRIEMSTKVTTKVKALKNHSPKLFLAYNKSGCMLPSEASSTQDYEV